MLAQLSQTTRNLAALTALVMLGATFTACVDEGTETEEDAWWLGTAEPSVNGKADSNGPLTIYLSTSQTDMSKILGDDVLGEYHRGRTGRFYLDGKNLTADTILILKGQVHTYAGEVEDHLVVVQPEYISAEQGAANPDGFFKVDFKNPKFVRPHVQDGAPFGETTGVFRGDIIATTKIGLDDDLSDDIRSYLIEPNQLGERPPNYLRDINIQIRPVSVLTTLTPAGGCDGDVIVDGTLVGTSLKHAIALDGFPKGEDVDVVVTYREPKHASNNWLEAAWDFASGWALSGTKETVVTRRVHISRDGLLHVRLDDWVTSGTSWSTDIYNLEIEVQAMSSDRTGPASRPYTHNVSVVEPEAEVVVDYFELCPLDDKTCRDFRDADAADNVIARRNIVEYKANDQGLYNVQWRPIGRCAGGDTIGGSFAESCIAYREEEDFELNAKVEAELNFELNVNGRAQGEASWSGSVAGMASAEIEGAFEGAFDLNAELDSSFKTSRTWVSRRNLDVFYDPSNTQIQWWRVVVPRLYYMEVASFDACGVRIKSNELFLEDLRDSRLVLACEEVASFDTACHAVEPTAEAVNACNDLLWHKDSEEAQACLNDE